MAEGTVVAAAAPTGRTIRPTPVPASVDCAVVVVTHNSGRDIDGLLASLPGAAPGLRLQVVVVDSGSSDDTVWRVLMTPGVECIEADGNVGYAAGINLGRARTDARAPLLVLNPDVRMQPGSITRMLRAADDPRVGAVVPKLVDGAGRRAASLRREPSVSRALGDALFGGRWPRRPGWLTETVWNDAPYERAHDVDWGTGAAFLVTAACEARVGQWDEQYFLYSEEVDYSARVRDAGYRVRYEPGASVVHTEGGSGTGPDLAALMAVNRARYYAARHDARSAGVFRSIVVLHALLRLHRPEARVSLRALVEPRSADRIIHELVETGQ